MVCVNKQWKLCLARIPKKPINKIIYSCTNVNEEIEALIVGVKPSFILIEFEIPEIHRDGCCFPFIHQSLPA